MNEQQLENALITAPIQAQERIATLDVIRGVALLGIFLIHFPAWFGSPALYVEALGINLWTSVWDTTVQSFIGIFALGKFYTMFTFLFGLGFVIFFERAKARTSSPKLLFFKRLSILLIIGLVHGFFIWHGDVLALYALYGLLLPLFFHRQLKTLIIWTVVFFSLFLLIVAAAMSMQMMPESMQNEMVATMQNALDNSFAAYGDGAFAAIMAQRTADVMITYTNFIPIFFMYFPLMLLGVYAGRKGIFHNTAAHLPFIKKAWLWGLAIGLPMSIVKYVASYHADHIIFNGFTLLQYTAGILGDTGLSIFYMASIVLLCQKSKEWTARFKPFGYVGRMALSNYLLQSIIGTMIFYNYGLGLYGQIAPALGFVLAVLIFVIQIIISKWWLSRYQFGPMEWVWRSLTYGKRFKNSKD